MITILVAYDNAGLIGVNNTLPWYLPEELKLFKSRTLGGSLIMGRKTWESLPKRPLPGRLNAVVSTTMPDGFKSLQEAVEFANKENPDKEIFIIGGRQIYQLALDLNIWDRVLATHVFGNFDGNVYFPDIEVKTIQKVVEKYNNFEVVEIVKSH